MPLIGEGGGALLFVELEIALADDRHQLVDLEVEVGAVLGGAGNDQRRARLVDQDRVHFVDDGIGMAALHHLGARIFHVVAQVVEAEFVIGAVGDVGGVGGLALGIGQAMDDDAVAQAEEIVDLAHPGGVAAGQVVVDGDDVDALAGQGIEIDGERRHQGLAFTGAHFGDGACR